jgi:putative pyruvate formate lyase activating enzyme
VTSGHSRLDPAYLSLAREGELTRRARRGEAMLRSCVLCPRRCGKDRLAGAVGWCRAGALARVASWNLHRWEEPPLSGWAGSGAIFFSNCTARCLFCQNYPISQLGVGREVTTARLAEMMMELQGKGAHNINLVTPTHFVPQFLQALAAAIPQGFRLPIVYNTSGYESIETLSFLDGIVDVYLPDAKYADDQAATRISGYTGYVSANRAALREMLRQVGDELILDDLGIARRGMIIRHLVLPNGLSQTGEVLAWLAAELSPRVWVSLMDQYFPAHKAIDHPLLGRKVSPGEYAAALDAFHAAGLQNGWLQEHDDRIPTT